MRAYIRAVRDLTESVDADEAMHALSWGALRAHWSNLGEGARSEFVAVVEHFADRHGDPEYLMTLALIDPVGHGGEALVQVRRRTPVAEESLFALNSLGVAASAVWSANLALPFLRAAVDGFRAEGRLSQLGQALTFVAWDEVRMGNARAAVAAADEARRLCADLRQPVYAASASVAEVIARAERGADPGAEQRLAEAEGVFLAAGAHPMVALVQTGRGDSPWRANGTARPTFASPGCSTLTTPAITRSSAAGVLADLADAACHGDGDLAHVAAIAADWRRIADATNATHLRVQLRYVDALLAGEGEAGERFEELIAHSAAGWPYYRARAQLSYGGWLRRRRRAAQSRHLLREAAETLDALGAAVLAERARRELRASGETVPRRAADARDQLSPQELQIARLAAAGLSNREIGERLYLSHRTIGTHLYRLFPKLGVTTRAGLAAALKETGPGAVADREAD